MKSAFHEVAFNKIFSIPQCTASKVKLFSKILLFKTPKEFFLLFPFKLNFSVYAKLFCYTHVILYRNTTYIDTILYTGWAKSRYTVIIS